MLRRILPHISIILSLMFGVFLILNIRNPRMGFISGSISLWLLAILAAVSFANAIIILIDNNRD